MPQTEVTEQAASYLVEQLQAKMSSSVTNFTVQDLLTWVRQYRVMRGRNIDIPLHQIPIYEDMHPEVIVMKGTQIFISEYLINLSLWALDTKYANRGNVLYSMPTQTQMDDFSQSRIDKAIEESTYLASRFGKSLSPKAKKAQTDRTRLKRLMGSALHMRGSDTVRQLISIDADIVINDEVDFFSEETIKWSKERLGASEYPLFRAVSKPTYPGQGIDLMFASSDRREWHIKCEHCNKWQPITWDNNILFGLEDYGRIITDVKVVCSNPECRKDIDRLGAGEWVAEYPSRSVHGYHVSRLLSPLVNLRKMVEDSLQVSDIPTIQSFYNAGLGLAYAPRGGKLDETELFYENDIPLQPSVAGFGGVDVGLKLHASVIESDGDSFITRQLDEFDTFEELDIWWTKNNIKLCVIDARGDARATLEWAQRHPGRVYRWLHVENTNEAKSNDETQVININRTALLDNLFARVREGAIRFPASVRNILGFLPQMKALVRELVKDQRLNKLIPRYVGSAADHYAFAMAFSLLAANESGVTSSSVLVEKDSVRTRVGSASSSWTGGGSSRLLSKGWRI